MCLEYLSIDIFAFRAPLLDTIAIFFILIE